MVSGIFSGILWKTRKYECRLQRLLLHFLWISQNMSGCARSWRAKDYDGWTWFFPQYQIIKIKTRYNSFYTAFELLLNAYYWDALMLKAFCTLQVVLRCVKTEKYATEIIPSLLIHIFIESAVQYSCWERSFWFGDVHQSFFEHPVKCRKWTSGKVYLFTISLWKAYLIHIIFKALILYLCVPYFPFARMVLTLTSLA